jgi:hypothetical protein
MNHDSELKDQLAGINIYFQPVKVPHISIVFWVLPTISNIPNVPSLYCAHHHQSTIPWGQSEHSANIRPIFAFDSGKVAE